MFRLSLFAASIVVMTASISSAAVFVDLAPNPGNLVHDRSGEIQTVDTGDGDASGTNSNAYNTTHPTVLESIDTQIDIDAGIYTENDFQHTHLRFTGTTRVDVETFGVFESPEGEGEGEGGGGGEEEEEPVDVFVGVRSSLSLSAHTFAGVYGGSSATNFNVRLSESDAAPNDPAYVNVKSDNPPNGDGYRYFVIAPIGGEQLGDSVVVDLGINYNTDTKYGGANVANGSTTNEMLLDTDLSLDLTLNGSPVDLGGYTPGDGNDLATTFNASIGDVIGISHDLISRIGTNGALADMPPDNGLFANAHALGTMFLNLNLPLSTIGASPDDPILPVTPPANPGDPFILTGNLNPDGTGPGFEVPLWFDPVVAIGYEIEVEGADIASFTLPDVPFDADGFLVSYHDGSDWVELGTYFNNDEDFLDGLGVTRLLIEGIDESLGLDPLDPEAFAVGLTFENVTGLLAAPNTIEVTMTPQLIPEPTSLALLTIGALGLTRRRR